MEGLEIKNTCKKREDRLDMRKEIVSGARLTFIFVLCAFMVDPIVSGYIHSVDSTVVSSIITPVAAVGLYMLSKKHLPAGLFEASERMSAGTFFTAFGLFALLQFCTAASELFSPNDAVIAGSDTPGYIFYMGFIVPICEEIFFRGTIAPRYEKYGRVFSIVASSLLFGMYHINLIQLVSGFFAGLVFCYIAGRYRIIWSMLLHILNNGVFALLLKPLFKASGNAFLAKYGVVTVCAVFVVVGAVFAIRNHPVKKVRSYLSEGAGTEKGAYKALILNVWTILLLIIDIVVTIGLVYFGPEVVDSVTTIQK